MAESTTTHAASVVANTARGPACSAASPARSGLSSAVAAHTPVEQAHHDAEAGPALCYPRHRQLTATVLALIAAIRAQAAA